MITITRTPDTITVCGHAGYAPHGQDIVCASISSLFQTLIYSLMELTEDEIDHRQMEDIHIVFLENLSELGQLLVDSFFVGVKGVAASYPDYVTVTDCHDMRE